ncbi:MlaA family lipoprotein [Pseudomonas xionganensis]|uniref:VacJ family lipoprotein n=1 Tax=Pseudomonas xionganensis TaxID=2654845 RepID=A0A6I4KTA4_9PSED|nr:VacJ family lipoprotein [Pseudomonas xionganensis]MVW75830.1 VacJ family lipoprotein [Pseudomonas xionganensis]
MPVIAASWTKGLMSVFAAVGLCLTSSLVQASDEDPWQGYNRFMFRVNDNIDAYTLKPLAKGYQAVTPQPVEEGIDNVFRNIGDVRNLANNLLQGKLHDAGVDTGRLIFNTTFGLLGIFDVASKMGLQRSDEDFGQTLGAWGLGSGPYVVLPLLGPSTVRDTFGRVPDAMLTAPMHIDHVPTRNVVSGVEAINLRAGLLKAERMVSGDKYIFVRNAYLQNREFRVQDGQVEDDF